MHSNRLLKKPVEEHSPGARSSAVKAEGEFIQVGLQVVGANRPLMGAHQPPFYESGDSVHSREHFVRVFAGTLDGGTLVGVIGPGCSRIGCQPVRQYGSWSRAQHEPGERIAERPFRRWG